MIAKTMKPMNASPPITPPTIAPVLFDAGAGGSGLEGGRIDIDDAIGLDGRLLVGSEGIQDDVEIVDDAEVTDRVGREEAAACDVEVVEADVGATKSSSVKSADAQAR